MELGNCLTIEYYNKVLEIQKEIGDQHDVALPMTHIAVALKQNNELHKALEILNKSLEISTSHNVRVLMTGANGEISEMYVELVQSREALTYREQAFEIANEVIRQEYEYKFENQRIADSIESYTDSVNAARIIELKQSEVNVKDAELVAKTNFSYVLMAIIILIFAVAAIIYQRLRVTRYKNELIKKQKKLDLSLVISDNKMRHEFNEQLFDKLYELERMEPEVLKRSLKSFQHEIKNQLKVEDRLELLTENLDEIHSEFSTRLKLQFSNLTDSEREVCHLIRLKMSIKEIANHRNTSEGAVKAVRHRIKTKLNIEGNLDDYIKNNI